jgi:hypothetical protein
LKAFAKEENVTRLHSSIFTQLFVHKTIACDASFAGVLIMK